MRTRVLILGGGFGLGAALALASLAAAAREVFADVTEGAVSSRKGGPGCLYGHVVDGHSGTVRCLSAQEVTPPAPYDMLPPPPPGDGGLDGGRDAGHAGSARRDAAAFFDSSSAIPLRSFSVSIENLSFESGEVPRAPAALDRLKRDFARCVAGESLPKSDASLDLRFLVRAPGRAEGVDVAQVRGLSADIVRCVTSQLAGRQVGSPSTDPVAVALTVRFKKD